MHKKNRNNIRNEHILIAILLIAIALISACAALQPFSQDQRQDNGGFFSNLLSSKSSQPLKKFERTGTDALEIKLLKDMPQDTIFAKDSFKIGVYLKNAGAADIEDGILNVINADAQATDSAAIEIKNKEGIRGGDERFSLKGKSPENSEGEQKLIGPFEGTVISKEGKKTIFSIDACFMYKTLASAEICIANSNVLQISSSCKVKEVSLSNGQGAPVAVTKVVPLQPQKKNKEIKYNFLIYVDNLGDGEVVDMNTGCAGNNKIYVDKLELSGKRLGDGIKCNLEREGEDNRERESKEARRYMTLKDKIDNSIADKENIIKCTATFNEDSIKEEFTTLLTIEMSYGYLQSIEKEVAIKDAVGFEEPEDDATIT